MYKKKGYVLLITIVITFVLSLTVVTMMSIVYRYNSNIIKRKEQLQADVYNPVKVANVIYDNYYFDI